MKTIFALSFLLASLSLCSQTFADEMPAANQLAQFGYSNCVAKTVFANTRTCGDTIAQLFDCGTRGTVLAIGVIRSDVADQCSPTVEFKEVLATR